jgi:hypothetical protein
VIDRYDRGRPAERGRPRKSAGWLSVFCVGGYNGDNYNVGVRRTDKNDGGTYIVVRAYDRNEFCGRRLPNRGEGYAARRQPAF